MAKKVFTVFNRSIDLTLIVLIILAQIVLSVRLSVYYKMKDKRRESIEQRLKEKKAPDRIP